MGYSFNPLIWFVCRICKERYENISELKQHKLENHLGDCLRIKCIIFEERLLDHDPDSGNRSSIKLGQCQKKSFRNPYVSVTKFTEKDPSFTPNKSKSNHRCYSNKRKRALPSSHPNLSTNKSERSKSVSSKQIKLEESKHEVNKTRTAKVSKADFDDGPLELEDGEFIVVSIPESSDGNRKVQFEVTTTPTTQSVAPESNLNDDNHNDQQQSLSNIISATDCEDNTYSGSVSSPPVVKSVDCDTESLQSPMSLNIPSSRDISSISDTQAVVITNITKNTEGQIEINLEFNTAGRVDDNGNANTNNQDNIEVASTFELNDAEMIQECHEEEINIRSNSKPNIQDDDSDDDIICIYDEGDEIKKEEKLVTETTEISKIIETKIPSTKRTLKGKRKQTFTNIRSQENDEIVFSSVSNFPPSPSLQSSLSKSTEIQIQETDLSSIPDASATIQKKKEKKSFLYPDPTEDSLLNTDKTEIVINNENPITCKLCNAKLICKHEAIFHGKKCFEHNKKSHILCIYCNENFESPKFLNLHKEQEHWKQAKKELENQNKAESINLSKKNVPLGKWLRKEREGKPPNAVLLDPDPTATKSSNELDFTDLFPIKCKLCHFELNSESQLKGHVPFCWLFNKKEHLYCHLCDLILETPSFLLEHNKIYHPTLVCPTNPSFECKLCGQKYFSKVSLNRHELIHNEIGVKADVYNVFDDEPINKNRLNCHIVANSEEQPYKCAQCPFATKLKIQLESHLVIHDKVTSHKCLFCAKYFSCKNDLQKHKQIHTGKSKPFKCDVENCDGAFSTKFGLATHKKGKHGQELGSPQLSCPICNKMYGLSDQLDFHIKAVHNKEKPYKCAEEGCSKAFTVKIQLSEHVKKEHTGEKPIQFNECSLTAAAARLGDFNNHHELHEVTAAYNMFPCFFCHKMFRGSWELNQHLKEHEKGNGMNQRFLCSSSGVEFRGKDQLKMSEKIHRKEGAEEDEAEAPAKSWSESLICESEIEFEVECVVEG